MEADEGHLPPPPPWKQNKSAAAIESSFGPLASSSARLSARSRAIPPARDFHFYNNFPSFKSPIAAAAARAESSLGILGASSFLPKQQQSKFPREDLDDAYDWLVARNDDLLEMFGASADEFKALREKEEAAGRKVAPDELAGDGFQVVFGNKKKKIDTGEEGVRRGEAFGASGSVRIATMDKAATSGTKPKVPFHIPTIPRPQDVLWWTTLASHSSMPSLSGAMMVPVPYTHWATASERASGAGQAIMLRWRKQGSYAAEESRQGRSSSDLHTRYL